MMNPDDAIISRLMEGEISAFRELYGRHKDAMLRLGIRILGNQQDAEDAVHDAFLVLYDKVGGFRGESSFRTWFYRIVVNTCLEARRKRRPMAELGGGALAVIHPDRLERDETTRILDQEIAALPPKQRMVISLVEAEGFSLQETAGIMGIRPGTARYHLYVAKKQLRQRLRPFLEKGSTAVRGGSHPGGK